jgi:predicted acylesterase/phospholipase RssA
VARLLDDVDAGADIVLLEVGIKPDPWSRRALGVADRVVVVATPDSAARSGSALRRLLDYAPTGVPRDLVLLRPDDGAPTGSGDLLEETGCRQVLHVVDRTPRSDELARVARLLTGRGRGLVLSGGGARGFAHLGVLRALEQLGIEVDVFAGSSIGSPLAAGMADGIAASDLIPMVEELFDGVLDYTVPVVALTSGRRIAAATRRVFGARDIEDLRHPFLCVSTDLTTARPHLHRNGSVVKAIRASCAIPGVLPPVPHDGHLLVDGGVTDNLPVAHVRELAPAGEVIAVDVVSPAGPRARDDYGLWVSGLRAVLDRRRRNRSLPPMGATIMRALTVASDQRRGDVAGPAADCHLRLDLRGVSMLDFTAVRSVAHRGYDQAMPVLEAWLTRRPARGAGAGGAS